MGTRGLIFISNSLENLNNIINKIMEIIPVESYLINYKDFKSAAWKKKLKKMKLNSFYIAIDIAFYNEVKDELNSFMQKALKTPFFNYIFITKEISKHKENKPIENSKICYFLSHNIDHHFQVVNFNNYIHLLFEKSLLSSRLSGYIKDSFKDAVYSEILAKKNTEIERLNTELKEMNRIDYLTNLYNRKALFEYLEKERKRTLRDRWRLLEFEPIKREITESEDNDFENKPSGRLFDHFGVFSVMMIDIDNFKSINDTYGHLVGDDVLKTLGYLLMSDKILRQNDIAGRFGGEEFVIILPATNSHNAIKLAKRLAREFKNTNFSDGNGNTFNATLSIGLSHFYITDNSNDDIIQRADIALYHAKKLGKDRIIIYEDIKNDI